MILLDTQSVIWLLQEPERLGVTTTQAIRTDAGPICMSAISCWEMGMLTSKGRIVLTSPLRAWITTAVGKGLVVVDVTREIGTEAGLLPSGVHGDPGDRIIIATARTLGCPLVTSDRKILAYAAAGHLRAFDARR